MHLSLSDSRKNPIQADRELYRLAAPPAAFMELLTPGAGGGVESVHRVRRTAG